MYITKESKGVVRIFNRNKGNWDKLRSRGFGDTAATRDVHGGQVFERGGREDISNPTARRVLAAVGAIITGALGVGAGYIFFILSQLMSTLTTGQSIVGFKIDSELILGDWRLWAFGVFMALLSGLIYYERLMAGWRSENSMADTSDINPHMNDQHVMLVEEMQESLDWFPDTGAHSSIQVSSMLSHVMMSNKGLDKVKMAKRYDKDVLDENGQVLYYKGALVQDAKGEPVMETLPIIDEDFGQDLLTASGIPVGRETKSVRQAYDVRKIPYNPPIEGDEKKKKPQRIDRDKLNYDTVGDLVNDDWEIPIYEVQRPAGAYLVDTAPVNTMVLAITRAGKGYVARFV